MQLTRLAAVLATAGIITLQSISYAQSSTAAEEELRGQIQDLRQKLEQLEKKLEQQASQPAAPVPAAPSTKEQALQQRVEELDQQVKVLGRKQDLQQEETAAAKAEGPKVSAGENGLSVSSADGQNQFRLRGLIQSDARFFTTDQPNGISDTFLLRRVRPIFEGTLFGIYDFRFVPDFGGGRAVVQDAYLDARFQPWAKLRAGKFKEPVSLERLQSASDLRFVERAFPTDILPNRDIGVQLHGELLERTLEYQVGVFNGTPDGRSSDDFPSEQDINSDKDVAARLFAQPFRNSPGPLQGLGFGIAGTFADFTQRSSTTVTDTGLPQYRSIAQQIIYSYRTGATNGTYAAGNRLRWTPQLYYYWNSLGVIGEYARVSQDVRRNLSATTLREEKLDNSAWQVAVTYVLTGEDNSFRGVKPSNPFAIGKPGWGAFEVGARFTKLKLDADSFTGGANSFADPSVSVKSAKTWGIVLNWYLNSNIKFQLDFESTKFEGGAGTLAAVRDREDENLIFGRFQVAF
jgi:phosphate-selective porin OprO and OprP